MKDYQLIDYQHWDFHGKGRNIDSMMDSPEKLIWNSALPLQDKRNDKGHAEFVTYFALKLLEQIPAQRNIVVPAAILHDTGWNQMSKTELELFYDKNWQRYEPVLRARHQEEGARVAEETLIQVNRIFPNSNVPHILEIISQHDTRNGFYSTEDGVMRDADKLWRFTLPHLDLYLRERKVGIGELQKQLDEWMAKSGFFYSPISREIAELEMENMFSAQKARRSTAR